MQNEHKKELVKYNLNSNCLLSPTKDPPTPIPVHFGRKSGILGISQFWQFHFSCFVYRQYLTMALDYRPRSG